jgi:GT2 family glycosyltransferase
MNFTLIICTYRRPHPLLVLLESVKHQTLYPNEIIIVDGSPDTLTKVMIQENNFKNVFYFKVSPEERGLTKQRNYGIARVQKESEVVCFLDDDTVLKPEYFYEVIHVFKNNSEITGVGGVAINENKWVRKKKNVKYGKKDYFLLNDFVVKEASRNKIRNYLGLQSDRMPGVMPEFSHGRTCGYPLDGENYEVDLLIGMSMSFRKDVTDNITFSYYFEGYGLYEDADFSIRALKFGKNVISTKAQLEHHHDAAGRPNQYAYGKMVVRNGWYVWRVKYPNPSFKAKLKWHAITLVLIAIRATNIVTTLKTKEAFTETIGRIIGWFSLWFIKPR